MMRRWILIVIAISFHKAYAKDQCQPKTDDLQMAQACYGGDMGSVESEAKFMNAIYATDNGVNFCYNTLAFLSREGGRTKVEVVHENKDGQLRSNIYNFDSKAVFTAEKSVVVLKDLKARCFAINTQNDHCSGSSDIPVAITLGGSKNDYSLEGYTKDRNLIEDAQGQGIKNTTSDFNQQKAALRIRDDIHTRLMAKTNELLTAKAKKTTSLTAYKQCFAAFKAWTSKLESQGDTNMANAFTKDENVLIDKVFDNYNLRKDTLSTDAPAGAHLKK